MWELFQKETNSKDQGMFAKWRERKYQSWTQPGNGLPLSRSDE
jgi:hypothetical protein